MRRTLACLGLSTSLLVVAAGAGAQAPNEEASPPDDREAEARALFEAARTAYESGHFEDALERFRESYELSGRPGLLFNVGTTAERLRRDEEALAAYEAYLEARPDAPNSANVRARVEILRRNLAEDGGGPADDPGATIAGGVITGLGLVGLGVGWGLFVDLLGAVDSFRDDPPTAAGFLQRQAAMDERETALYFTGVISGAVATAGLPLLLPSEEGTPWWSWVLGVAGLGAVGGGIAALAIEGSCVDQACTRREPLGALGAHLLGHGAPLLAVPLVYLLREVTGGDEVRVEASASPSGGHLAIGGSL